MTAITNARTAYLNGTTSGWAAECLFYIASKWWLCVQNTSAARLDMYKSTDGVTWTLSATGPSNSASGGGSYSCGNALSGSTTHEIYVACHDGTSLNLHKFNTSTESWSSLATAATGTNTAYSVSVQVRSNGDVLIMHSTNAQVLRLQRYISGSMDTAVTLDTPFSNMSAAAGIMTANSNLACYYWVDTFAADFTTRYYDSANSLGTIQDLDTSVSTSPQLRACFPGYINDGGTHRMVCATIDSTGELDFYHSTNGTYPLHTTVNSVSPTSTTDPGAMGSVCVAFGGKWYVIWSGDGRGSIHMDVSDDLSSPAFGTDTNVITGLSNDPGVFARTDGTYGILVVYTDHTTPSVDSIFAVGTTPPSGLSGKNNQVIIAGI